jgi:hypothetical protein
MYICLQQIAVRRYRRHLEARTYSERAEMQKGSLRDCWVLDKTHIKSLKKSSQPTIPSQLWGIIVNPHPRYLVLKNPYSGSTG